MNITGILVGLATFLVIGICHPIVIKAEYHWGKGCWWIFALVGLVTLALSLWAQNHIASTLLGVTSFSAFWSILELIEQEKRVQKGWFPKNPKRKKQKP